MGTLLAATNIAALSHVPESEARFLSVIVSDAVRQARQLGRFKGRFLEYELQAWREPLGARLCTVSWCVWRANEPLARDVAILYA